METAIDGLQGPPGHLGDRDRVLATAKHFAGDGDTTYGTSTGDDKIDQGIALTNRADFWRTSLQQYVPAIQQHNVGTVMPSYSSVDWTEDGLGNPIKMHGNMELRTDVLKGSLKFDGFVISDWEGIHQLPGDWPTQVRSGVNAGIDMMMEPSIYKEFETTLADEVNAGRVSMSRINDAVSRILTKKFELDLFEHPYTDRTNLPAIGSPAHRAVAQQGRCGVPSAAQECQERPADHDPGPDLCRRQQRRQHRQPGRRMDADLAGRFHHQHPGHQHSEWHPQGCRACVGDLQRGRQCARQGCRHGHRRRGRDAVF